MIWGVALSAAFPSVSCRKQPPAAPTPAPSTTKTAEIGPGRDDLQVTPLGAGHNEIAEILGIRMWRFHLVCGVPGVMVLHTIDLRDKGQWAKQIACGISRWPDSDRDEQMTVALYPLDGDLNTSDKLKTYVRIGGATFSSVGDNPLKGRQGITTLSVANRQKDGGFLLMQSSDSGHYPDENALQLVLKISLSKAEDTPPPP